MTASETLESYRRQLAIEEQSCAEGSQTTGSVPVMNCLRSPTTRTVLSILQNQNHFEVIKEFVLEAEAEEKRTQNLIDMAEDVQAVPIASAFSDAVASSLSDDTIQFRLPRNAAGDVLGVREENSAILTHWGKKPPRTLEAGGDNDDHALDAPIEVLCVTHKTSPCPTTNASSLAKELRMPDHDINGEAVSAEDPSARQPSEMGKTDGQVSCQTKSLQRLLQEQSAMSQTRERELKAYQDNLSSFLDWQQSRLAMFDHLLEPFPEGTRQE